MDLQPSNPSAALNELVDEYRARYLWSLRLDYYPTTLEQRLAILDTIQRHGDVEAYRRAAALRQWLLQHSSEASAGS